MSYRDSKLSSGKPAVLVNVNHIGERKQAIVKPVLTHVIEGFVIQEATTPFPVSERMHRASTVVTSTLKS